MCQKGYGNDMKDYLNQLEEESIYIIREIYAEFNKPVLLYSVGKDSGVLVRLCQKAFAPGKIPFPVMHVDTGFKFDEMYRFRKRFVEDNKLDLILHSNHNWIEKGCSPLELGTDICCQHLKTEALLDGIKKYGFDAAIGGARREEEKSRAKERIFSVRNKFGKWDPKNQRPELWNLYNTFLREGHSMRVFPLSNWTEIEIWQYIEQESIPVVPLYFAKERKVKKIKSILSLDPDGEPIMCRFRSLGCVPCTGAVISNAKNINEIINELKEIKRSERENRLIDLNSDSSMEDKKKEGYF